MYVVDWSIYFRFIYLSYLCDLGTSRDYSNGVGHSATTNSSAGLSRFSAAFSDDGCMSGDMLPTPNLKVYSFADLKSSTRNFKSDMVLGVGGFGTVYKGWVDEKNLLPSKSGTGMMVAIKKLNPESVQGFEEWQVISFPFAFFIFISVYFESPISF